MQTEYTKKVQEKQVLTDGVAPRILRDVSPSGRVRPWAEKKGKNLFVADTYDYVNPRKAARLRDCANYLLFGTAADGRRKLVSMNACKVRLCPVCTWRRSLKIYGQTLRIVNALQAERPLAFLFLTLTVKSVEGPDLSATIDAMFAAWNRLLGYKAVKAAVKGFWRGLEITHDVEPYITSEMWNGSPKKNLKPRAEYYQSLGLAIGDANPNYDTYHPHFHAVLAVLPSYFTGRDYISAEKWRAMWQKAARLEYVPQVNVKRVKGSLADAVAEVAKYAVKDADYIVPEDFNLSVATVAVLDKALDHRRLSMYGGCFREMHKRLALDDEMDGDLVHVGAEVEQDSPLGQGIFFVFHVGYGQYLRVL